MTDINFEDAVPVKTTTVGKPKEPNPYLNVIQSIAKKTYDDGPHKGEPIAKSFVVTKSTDDAHKTFVAKVKRQMSAAGEASTPPVTVLVREQPVKLVVAGKETSKDDPSKVRLVFWTIDRQIRTRKETAPAATPETAPAATTAE